MSSLQLQSSSSPQTPSLPSSPSKQKRQKDNTSNTGNTDDAIRHFIPSLLPFFILMGVLFHEATQLPTFDENDNNRQMSLNHRRDGVSSSGDGISSKEKIIGRKNRNGNNKSSKIESGDNPIEVIALVGERNSGTSWMFEHLQECFSHDLKVKKGLTRDKHWFQVPSLTPHDPSQTHPLPPTNRTTLVVAQFRNPYHWIEAMRQKPHHSPKHMFLDWKTFVTTPWTMPRIGSDATYPDRDKPHQKCQGNYTFDEVISCAKHPLPKSSYKWKTHFSETNPIYEMRNDGSGMPYGSVLQLRRDKIVNHLSTFDYDYVRHGVVVRYEDMLTRGTRELMEAIEDATGVEMMCEPVPAQKRPTRELEGDFVEWMDKYVDWETEGLVGYEKGDYDGGS